mgnify:CR=1 FL=1
MLFRSGGARPRAVPTASGTSAIRIVETSTAKPHAVSPGSFNDAQEIGDRFKSLVSGPRWTPRPLQIGDEGVIVGLAARPSDVAVEIDGAPPMQGKMKLPEICKAAEYEQRVSTLVASDPALAEYVKELKRRENAAFEVFQDSLTETLDVIQTIRAANREGHYLERVVSRARDVRDHSVSFAWKSEIANRISFQV